MLKDQVSIGRRKALLTAIASAMLAALPFPGQAGKRLFRMDRGGANSRLGFVPGFSNEHGNLEIYIDKMRQSARAWSGAAAANVDDNLWLVNVPNGADYSVIIKSPNSGLAAYSYYRTGTYYATTASGATISFVDSSPIVSSASAASTSRCSVSIDASAAPAVTGGFDESIILKLRVQNLTGSTIGAVNDIKVFHTNDEADMNAGKVTCQAFRTMHRNTGPWRFLQPQYGLNFHFDYFYAFPTAVTRANPGVFTYTPANYYPKAGQVVRLAQFAGMTELNGNKYRVSAGATKTTFSLEDVDTGVPLDTTSFGAFTGTTGSDQWITLDELVYSEMPTEASRVWVPTPYSVVGKIATEVRADQLANGHAATFEPWLCAYAKQTDAFMTSAAADFWANYPAGKVYIEPPDELWNPGTPYNQAATWFRRHYAPRESIIVKDQLNGTQNRSIANVVIVAASQANPCVIDTGANPHYAFVNDTVIVSGATGMTQLNATWKINTRIDNRHVTLKDPNTGVPLDSSGFAAYNTSTAVMGNNSPLSNFQNTAACCGADLVGKMWQAFEAGGKTARVRRVFAGQSGSTAAHGGGMYYPSPEYGNATIQSLIHYYAIAPYAHWTAGGVVPAANTKALKDGKRYLENDAWWTAIMTNQFASLSADVDTNTTWLAARTATARLTMYEGGHEFFPLLNASGQNYPMTINAGNNTMQSASDISASFDDGEQVALGSTAMSTALTTAASSNVLAARPYVRRTSSTEIKLYPTLADALADTNAYSLNGPANTYQIDNLTRNELLIARCSALLASDRNSFLKPYNEMLGNRVAHLMILADVGGSSNAACYEARFDQYSADPDSIAYLKSI